jgi:hypothetical protein
MAKKKAKAENKEVIMDRMPGSDPMSTEDTKGFEANLNFMDDSVETEEVEFPKETEIEEVNENELTTTVEEVEASANAEAETESVETGETGSEETVENQDTSLAQPDIQPVEAASEEVTEQKAPMVPKSRLDEVLAKQKALQKQLDDYTKSQEEAKQQLPDYDFASKEAEYQTLVLDGEAEKAVALRNQIRQAEKDQFMFEVQQKMGQTVQQSQELTELQAKAAEIQASFPVLDENSAEYDVELQNEVLSLRDAFITQGYVPADALTKATEYTIAAKKPELLNPQTASSNVSQETKKTQELQQKANVSKKLQAADSQPPQMKGESTGNKTKNLDINKLSEKEFGALPEDTLRRLRGDFA